MRPWGGLVIGLLVLIAGCTTVHPRGPAGFGTYSYVSGTLTWTYPVALHTAWEATLQALRALQLRIKSQTIDGLGGNIEAVRADATRVHIRVKPVNERTTRVQVRVGTFGNREYSERIHTAIRSQLKL